MPRILFLADHPAAAAEPAGSHAAAAAGWVHVTGPDDLLAELGRDLDAVVVLDVLGGGLDAAAWCARVRSLPGPPIPVLGLVADEGSARSLREAGADDVLAGPEAADPLARAARLRTLLRLAEAQADARARRHEVATFHEMGRQWSSLTSMADFTRVLTGGMAAFTGAPICLLALYEPATRTLRAAAPAIGLDGAALDRLSYALRPEHRSLWNFAGGRPYLSNRARQDPHLVREMVEAVGAESVLLVPLLVEGQFLGLLVAVNKPGGFADDDLRLLSTLSGPTASFLHTLRVQQRQSEHAQRLERVAALVGEMVGCRARGEVLGLVVSRLCRDLGYEHAVFHGPAAGGARVEAEAGGGRAPLSPELLRFALHGGQALPAEGGGELAVPVRAGDTVQGVLAVRRAAGGPFREEELSLLQTLSGQLAAALSNLEGTARTERLARQMATLYELGLETSAQRDLARLCARAAEEAGRLIDADHASVFRVRPDRGHLEMFAGWTREGQPRPPATYAFAVEDGVAGRVVRERVPALVNDPAAEPGFVHRGVPVGRLLCVPVVFYDREAQAPQVFGVVNATRVPGGGPFTLDDLEYLTRFASQLAIAAANSVAFAAERERSEQLAVVNRVLRDIAGALSRDRVLETATRRIQEAFGFPLVEMVVPDAEAGVNRVVAACGPDQPPASWRTYPLTAGVTGQVLRDKRSVVLNDVAQDSRYIEVLASTRAEAMIPVLSGGEVLAVLNVESHQTGVFGPSLVLTLETLADGIAIALGNADLYQALERTNAQLLEVDRTRSELVNMVAHDFRGPLAGVVGSAELLEWRPEAPPAERVELARAILQASSQLAAMVHKTLQIARLESGRFPFEFAVMDLGAAVRAAVERVPADPRCPVALDLPEDPVACWADPARLAEVLENLLANALRFSPDGGAIRVAVARGADSAMVSVSDRGLGIDPAHHDRLFRPFSRVRAGRVAELEGSGLGLYLCDRIVRAHGGRLGLRSAPGEGSTFSFTVPLFGLAVQTRPPLLLLATRDETSRREVRALAREHGREVQEVGDGVEVLEAAARLLPAAVIVDRVLPRLGATEVVARLRESAATREVPVVVLGHPEELGEAAALFRACVPKPVLRGSLAEALGLRAPRPSAP